MSLSKYLKSLASDDKITAALERYWAKRAGETKARWGEPLTFLSPSAAGGECERDLQLALLGSKTSMDEGGHRRVGNGTKVHERVNEYLIEAGIAKSIEQRLIVYDISHEWHTSMPREEYEAIAARGGVNWSGEADVIDNWGGVGDVKSMNSHGFKNLPAQLPNEEDMCRALLQKYPGYVRQLIHYRLWMSQYSDDVDKDGQLWFYFENKDNQDYKILTFRPDARAYADAFVRPEMAVSATSQGTLIEPPFERFSSRCRKCYREQLCYDLQDEKEEPWKMVNDRLKKRGV